MAQDMVKLHQDIDRPMEAGLMPSLPPALLSVIEFGVRQDIISAEKGGGTVPRERRDWDPPTIDGALISIARAAHHQLLDYLEPMDEAQLSDVIARLRAHNWRYAPRNSTVSEEELHADWVVDLAEYPAFAIKKACEAWRRGHDEKPTIAGIRELCDSEVMEARLLLRLIDKLIRAQRREAA